MLEIIRLVTKVFVFEGFNNVKGPQTPRLRLYIYIYIYTRHVGPGLRPPDVASRLRLHCGLGLGKGLD